MWRHLTLREALASGRLADFVRQAEARGLELSRGSDLERALALLITQRRIQDRVTHETVWQTAVPHLLTAINRHAT
jgi:hypothetical protein